MRNNHQPTETPNLVDISNDIRTSLLKHLGTKQTAHQDVGSHVSGVSAHTDASDFSNSSTVNSNNSINRALKTKDIALQLASSCAKQAEQDQLIKSLKQQMEQLQRINDNAASHQQQGTPPLVEAEPPPPTTPGEGRLCRDHRPSRDTILFGHWRMSYYVKCPRTSGELRQCDSPREKDQHTTRRCTDTTYLYRKYRQWHRLRGTQTTNIPSRTSSKT